MRLKAVGIVVMVGVVLGLVAQGLAQAAPPKAEDLSGHVSMGIDDSMVGTLCSKDGFTCLLAPAYTQLIVMRQEGNKALKAGDITKKHAVVVQQQLDQARKLLDASKAACLVDLHTEKCLGNQSQATALLSQARAVLAGVK